MKVNQLALIQDLIIDKNFSNSNVNIVSIKVGFITMMDVYKIKDIHTYYWLIAKLIYFLYETRPDIVFAIGQLSK